MALNLPVNLDLGLGPAVNNILLLLIIAMFAGFLALGIAAIVYILSYRIKCVVFPAIGIGKKDALGIGKRKWQRFKWNKTKTAWKPLFPLFNSKTIEPFSNEFIYSGNNVFAIELPDKSYIPIEINILSKTDDEGGVDLKTITAMAMPTPYYLSKWNEIEIQQDEIEFSKKNFWTENKYLIMFIITLVVCSLILGLTVWLTFKFAGGKFDAILEQGNRWVDALGKTMEIPAK